MVRVLFLQDIENEGDVVFPRHQPKTTFRWGSGSGHPLECSTAKRDRADLRTRWDTERLALTVSRDQCQHLWNLITAVYSAFDFEFYFCTTTTVRTCAWKMFDSFYSHSPVVWSDQKQTWPHCFRAGCQMDERYKADGIKQQIASSTVVPWLLRLCPKPATLHPFICSHLTTILTLLFKLLHTT